MIADRFRAVEDSGGQWYVEDLEPTGTPDPYPMDARDEAHAREIVALLKLGYEKKQVSASPTERESK